MGRLGQRDSATKKPRFSEVWDLLSGRGFGFPRWYGALLPHLGFAFVVRSNDAFVIYLHVDFSALTEHLTYCCAGDLECASNISFGLALGELFKGNFCHTALRLGKRNLPLQSESVNMAYGDTRKICLHTSLVGNLWQKIREARNAAGLSQQDLADACEVTRNAVSLWESDKEQNRTEPSFDKLKIISIAVQRPISWFFDENPITTAKTPVPSKEEFVTRLSQLSPAMREDAIAAAVKSMSPKGRVILARKILTSAEGDL